MVPAQTIVNLHPVLRGDGYEWGWSFWVAVGTLGLALATSILALKTKAVATATNTVATETKKLAAETTELAKRTAEDVSAQFRPILVPDTYAGRPVPTLQTMGKTVRLYLRNSGNGPAIDIRANLFPLEVSPRAWDSGVLSPARVALLVFEDIDLEGIPGDPAFTVECSYTDLAKNRFKTNVVIQFRDDHFRIVSTPIEVE